VQVILPTYHIEIWYSTMIPRSLCPLSHSLHNTTTMSKLPPASSFDDIPSISRLFCYKCKRCNFSNYSKGHRSHVQHQHRCTRLSKCGVKDSGCLVSGTDPLPLLTKKRRIDELDFNFAYKLDNYLEDNDTHDDNVFDVNVDSDGSSHHGSIPP